MAGLLTDKFCRLAKPPKEDKVVYWDGSLEGFGLRVTSNGHKAFILNYRIGAKQRRFTIGSYPEEFTAMMARDRAQELRQQVRAGNDPFVVRAQQIQESKEAEARGRTVRDLTTAYMDMHVKPYRRPKTILEYQAQIAGHILPRLGRMRVGNVLPRDIIDLHVSLKATPYLANRIVALIGAMFSWAKKTDAAGWGVTGNPADAVQRYAEDARESWLTAEEIERLAAALDAYPDQSVADLKCSEKQKEYHSKEATRIVAAVRLLFYTGSRAREVLQAEWTEFDLERKQWNKPARRTKQKHPSIIPLSEEAIDVVKSLLPGSSKWLFPGRHPGEPLGEIKGAWHEIRKAAKLPTLRVHDLRHNFGSWLASDGESLLQIGKLLGHAQSSTTERYAALQNQPLREAANRFATLTTRRADASTPAQR